jgi:hypothetical protein
VSIYIIFVAAPLNGKFIVKVDEQWNEPVLLYQLFIAPSGQLKSSFINMFKEPLSRELQVMQNVFDEEIYDIKPISKLVLNSLQQSLTNETKNLAKKCRNHHDKLDIASLVSNVKEIYKEHIPYITEQEKLLNKIRPELFVEFSTELGLFNKMKDHGCLAICEPESFFIEKLNGKKGNDLLLQMLLKSYGDKSISYDKYHNNVTIENPRLNIMSGTQPETAVSFFNCERNINSGLLGRFFPIFINPNAFLINDNQYKDTFTNYRIYFNDAIQRIFKKS